MEDMNALLARSTWERIGGVVATILAFLAAINGYSGDPTLTGQMFGELAFGVISAVVALKNFFSAELERELGAKRLTILGHVISEPGS